MSNQETQSDLFPSDRVGVLNDVEIEATVGAGFLISRDTFQQTSLEGSSYDIRVGNKGILGGQGVEIDLRTTVMELEPGAYAGVVSLEKLRLPSRICARIGSKRALSYDGVILLTGSLVDPGYEGHLLFGLYNASQRRVLIRAGRKICNIVFEGLPAAPERRAPADPNLLNGEFPDAFADRMANMDVLPWMQISERVKQIEGITKDILDLKARYDDVLEPIRDLTDNVQSLTRDVASLTQQTKGIAKDVEDVNGMVAENSKQINQLMTSLASVAGTVRTVEDRSHTLEESDRTQMETITTLRTRLGRFQVLIYAFWALLLLGLGALIPEVLKRFQ